MAKTTPKTTPNPTHNPAQPAQSAETRMYTVRADAGEIHHDGMVYRAGDAIALTDGQAAPMAHLLSEP